MTQTKPTKSRITLRVLERTKMGKGKGKGIGKGTGKA
jgi:hypothetical protein